MPTFSKRSLDLLSTCHPLLQELMGEVIKVVDIAILCGHRGKAAQNLAFDNHTSTLAWPKSRHNSNPSTAVDVAPYPIDWDDLQRFRDLAVIIKGIANDMNIKVEWGGNWKTFKDLPHWQLAE